MNYINRPQGMTDEIFMDDLIIGLAYDFYASQLVGFPQISVVHLA